MSTDAVIEATAKKLSGRFGGPVEAWLPDARDLANAGLLATELPLEPPPVGQVRRHPDDEIVAIRTNEIAFPWRGSDGERWDDDDVRDWPVLVPETDLDDLRAERDRLDEQLTAVARGRDAALARIAELEETAGCAVDVDALALPLWNTVVLSGGSPCPLSLNEFAAAIREHLPAATRPALPEGHVAVDLRGVSRESLGLWATSTTRGGQTVVSILKQVCQAELARRAAEGGEQE